MQQFPKGDKGDGSSWTGQDPRLRLLRTLAGIVLMALMSAIILDATLLDHQPVDIGALAALVGALLVVLGFEAGVRFPSGKE
jgi:hypothetical protein